MTMRVDLEDLQRKSAAIRTELANLPQPGAQGQIAPPSAHQVSTESAMRLGLASLVVWMYQAWGTKEGERLAESLDATRAAYQAVDTASQQSLNSGGSQPITVMTEPVAPPPVPTPPGHIAPPPAIGPGGFATPVIVQQQLDAGDQGTSLRHYSDVWKGFANQIRGCAPAFDGRVGDWEGTAASAAYAKFNSYRAWLDELADSWEDLSAEATRLADVHHEVTEAHRPIAEQYEQAEKKLADATNGAQVSALFAEMQSAQVISEALVGQYAAGMSPKVVQPTGSAQQRTRPHGRHEGRQRRRPARPDQARRFTRRPGRTGPWRTGAGRSGPWSPADDGTGLGRSAGRWCAVRRRCPFGWRRPIRRRSAVGRHAWRISGWRPVDGNAEVTDGSQPAASRTWWRWSWRGRWRRRWRRRTLDAVVAGGRRRNSGADGPNPRRRRLAPAAGSTGAAGGAMGGGMAPMGHGAGHNQGKEKRRDPNLSPDEDLYTEDRPWTEAVIGNRRRRNVQDGKEAE